MALSKTYKIAITLGMALVAGFFIALLAHSSLLNHWQLQFADYLYQGYKPKIDIVIVAIDTKSISQEFGLGSYETWNRAYYAKVVENIKQYKPKLVAFDINFKSKKDEAGDTLFQTTLSSTQKPIMVFSVNPDYDAKKGFFIQKANNVVMEKTLKIFSDLPNMIVGFSTGIPDKDSVVRRLIPLVFDEASNQFYENFGFALARRILGDDPIPANPQISLQEYIMKIGNKDLKIPLEEGQMLINYFSNPSHVSFSTVSFVDVYNENYKNINPEEFFKNKIVLIGPSAINFRDYYLTPVNKIESMIGVEIQANALQTILDQAFLRNLTFPEKTALIIILSMAAAFMFMYTRIRWSVAFLVIVPLLYTAVAPFAFQQGIILDLVHPYITIDTLFISVYMYRYLTEFKEKTALRGAFAKYVNPGVVDQILAHPENLKLGGEKREVSVLFTDIAHFTSISEKLKPESLVALLNEYFEAMSEVILEEGGTLDKFEGDAVMAFFGAPLLQTDHANRACRTALKMRQKLAQLLKKWQTDPLLPGGEKKPMIDFRCGISTGEVIVGNMGSETRFDYTVMGDVVNLGSRLEGANKKYSTNIMISEATANVVLQNYEMRELDVIKVMGKSQPIKVFELLNLKGQLVPQAANLLQLYNEGIQLYHQRKFAEALEHFNKLLLQFINDGPSKLYKQRCEVLKDFPPPANWDGVFEMGTK